MPESQKIDFLQRAANSSNQLLTTWTTISTNVAHNAPCTATTYKKYIEFLNKHTKKLDQRGNDNAGRIANTAKTDFMDSDYSDDDGYNYAAELSTFVANSDIDNKAHYLLKCNIWIL